MKRRITIERSARLGSQRGFSLITALLFTVAVLILGISVMGVNVMQERVIGNTRDHELALQAAEAALRDAELDVATNVGLSTAFSSDCANGLCTPPTFRTTASPLPVDGQSGFDWSDADAVRTLGQHTDAAPYPGVVEQPVYVIEKLGNLGHSSGDSMVIGAGPSAPGTAYRITARALGARAETEVILQTIYATR